MTKVRKMSKQTHMARLTSKGQITLPKELRDELSLTAGDSVLFEVYEGYAVLAKIPSLLEVAGSVHVPPEMRGKPWKEIREAAARKRAEEWKKKWG